LALAILLGVLAACGAPELGVESGGAAPATTTTVAPPTTLPPTTTVAHTTTAPPTTAPPTTAARTTVESTTTVPEPTIPPEPLGPEPTVISVGDEPRTELRIDAGLATFVRVEEVLEQNVVVTGFGEHEEIDNSIRTVVVIGVESNRDGVLRATNDVESVDLGMLGSTMDPFAYLTTFDHRNRIIDARNDPTTTPTDDEVTYVDATFAQWESSAFVLPVDAVGVGAQWRQTVVVAPFGEPIDLIRTVVVTAINGSVVEMDVTLSGDAELFNASSLFMALPGAEDVRKVRVSVEGSGKMTFDLSQVAPAGEVDMTLILTGEVSRGGDYEDVVATVDQTLTTTVTPT